MAFLAAKDTTDQVWRAQDTSPSAVEGALRRLLAEAHAADAGYAPARVLNLICVVDGQYSGEVANRLRMVGRYHGSRTVVCSVDPRRTTLDAVATISAPKGKPGRETVVVDVGTQHLEHLDSVVDPLVVTDLTSVVWAPHGHPEAVDALLDLVQVVLVDSEDEPDPADAIDRAKKLMKRVYVVDLAWLRSTPWRERIAATFDPPALRGELRLLSKVTVRHHPDSAIAGGLLLGWLGSRLEWELTRLRPRGGELFGKAHTRRQDIELRLVPDPDQTVRGLAGVELETAKGRWLRLDRGPGGLRAHYRRTGRGGAAESDREWTILGASRGESGILGEGIRQAMLRDRTYRPALLAAELLLT